MESKIKHQYDASLALRAPASAALTADTTLTKLDIHRLTAGRGDLENRYGLGSFDVVVYVTSIVTGGMVAETYDLEFQTFDSAGANAVTHMTHRVAATGEPLVFTFHPESLKVNDADAAQFGINVNVAGTGPSIVLYAYAAPHSHA